MATLSSRRPTERFEVQEGLGDLEPTLSPETQVIQAFEAVHAQVEQALEDLRYMLG